MTEQARKGHPAWVLPDANPPQPNRTLFFIAAILLAAWNLCLLLLAAFTGHLLW